MEIDKASVMNFESSNAMNLTIQQFHEICRTCLVPGAQEPMFEMIYNQKSLSDILSICTKLQIHKEDYLPQNICSSCLSAVFQMYAFFQKCQESETVLRYVVNLGLKTKNREDNELVDSNESRDVTHNGSDSDSPKTSKIRRSRKKIRTGKIFKSQVLGSPFKCKQCENSFEEYTLLKQHHKAAGHLEVRTHTCPVCSKTFTNSKLRQHMRSHTKEKPYKCKICLQGFSMSGNLKRHMMTHTGERPHICEFCGKGFIQATTLYKHKKTHSKFEEYIGDCATGTAHFQCNYCGRAFKRLARYHAHVKRHDSKTGEILKTAVVDNEKPTEYICIICSRTCKTKHLLKAHERTHGEKSFLCNECGKSFITNAALQSHLKVHTGEKPYSCNICKKAFAHVGSFEAHMLIHTGQKPYQCTVCSRSFTQLTHLKYHTRTHSGERPYICSYCGKSFALKGNLTVHTRTHTGETPYVCSVCGKGFYDSSSMKKHKRGHVNNLPPAVPQMQPPLPPPPVIAENNLDANHMGYITVFHFPD